MAEAAGRHLFERRYDDDAGWFRTFVDERYWAVTRFHGRGTMAGARAFLEALDDGANALSSSGRAFLALVDLSDLRATPLRAQLSIGKWLFGNKKLFARIAIFGGRPWETRIARAIMAIARMDRVGFFDTEAPACAYLEDAAKDARPNV